MRLQSGMTVLDGTLGLGGHTSYILSAIAPNGVVIGFDADARNLALAKERLGETAARVTFIHDSYGNVLMHDVPSLDAALLDLGFSSVHVDDAARGFSFLREGPLDMRYDVRRDVTAEMIVNSWSRDELADIFRMYGEERFAPQIAKAICEARKKQRFTTTTQLAQFIEGLAGRRGKIHPATKVFQALRIAVNDEFSELQRGLEGITSKLKPGARFAVITFHSLEDRVVKQYFKNNETLNAVTKKPIVGSREEVLTNPRARSAKLRIVEKR